jgi:Domain of unknown function (DUF4157)
MNKQSAPPQEISPTPVGRVLLQRQCACGAHSLGGAECTTCKKRSGLIQRKEKNHLPINQASPRVHEVLRSSGHPLGASVRAAFEPQFGRSFGDVQIHTDAMAQESAGALNAKAYVVGRHIVFGSGQYQPGTSAGNHLLAHELTHVVQQSHASPSLQGKLEIGSADSASEREADSIADRVVAGQSAGAIGTNSSGTLMRTLRVEEADQPVPTPNPNGPTPTRAEAIEGYLRQLSPTGNIAVNRSSGAVSMDEEYCRGRGARFLNRLGHGFSEGARIGSYFLGVGALPGLIIGGLVGLVQGIAAAASGPESQAAGSSTPTGSTCLCEFVNGDHPWTIRVDDNETPLTGDNFVRIVGPFSPRVYGAATVSGQLMTIEPWLALGHELCGHAWLQEHNQDEGIVQGEDALHHHRTVERENLLRQEHGLEARGFRLREPYCGESFYRDRTNPGGAPHWQPLHNARDREVLTQAGHADEADDTYLDECQQQREQFLGELARRYRVDERIP